jgi:hypothetical protein
MVAKRLLGLDAAITDMSLRGLLAALSRGRAHERSVALMRLRGPLARGEAYSLDLIMHGESLVLELTPLSDVGWSITVELSSTRADRREL